MHPANCTSISPDFFIKLMTPRNCLCASNSRKYKIQSAANGVLNGHWQRFEVKNVSIVHRVGDLQIGDIAVWVGVQSAHRKQAFEACEYAVDELKKRAPIWKKEHYVDGDSDWVACHHCGQE